MIFMLIKRRKSLKSNSHFIVGMELKSALKALESIPILRIQYVLGTNKTFTNQLSVPVVIKYGKDNNQHQLTVTYF